VPDPLWLCVHLPRLPLEVFPPAIRDGAGPFVVSERQGQREWVTVPNDTAAGAGITCGMALGAAHALAERLGVRPRRHDLEQQQLTLIAHRMLRFSATVATIPPASLLLEAGGSLRLFDGPWALIERITQQLQEQGLQSSIAVAPTPTASRLLATNSHTRVVLRQDQLLREIRHLPFHSLATLAVAGTTLERLAGMGIQTLGDCLRLPRTGLARRLGPELINLLDRLTGHRPDPVTPYRAPPRFQATLTLPGETAQTETLLPGVRNLLGQLHRNLMSCDGAIVTLLLCLGHERRPDTRIPLELVAPNRDAAHWMLLLKEKLERLELPAPVISLGLSAEQILRFAHHTDDLFEISQPVHSWPQLVERLRGRLGRAAVTGLGTRADNRPERAWCREEPGQGIDQSTEKSSRTVTPRPLWLLPKPAPLAQADAGTGLPRGLTALTRSERIESGWWDTQGVVREYLRARDAAGRHLWVYREAGHWYLHGFFS
jgi:protein ImuB